MLSRTTSCVFVKSFQAISSYAPGICPTPLSIVEFQRTCFHVPFAPRSCTNVSEAQPSLSVLYPSLLNPEKLEGLVLLPNNPPVISKLIGEFLIRLSYNPRAQSAA